MARASSARSRKARASAPATLRWFAPGRLASESLGLLLVAVALFVLLALSSFRAADPLFRMAPVENLGGPLGASFAGLLIRGFGAGAFVLVALGFVVGARLVAGLRAAREGAGFWVGGVLLLAAASATPELLRELAPARFGSLDGGSLGRWLAEGERALLSAYGGLFLSALLAIAGALRVTATPTKVAVQAVLSGAAACGRAGLAAIAAADRGRARLAWAARSTLRGLRRTIEDARNRRAQRRRQRSLAPPLALPPAAETGAAPALPGLFGDEDLEPEGDDESASEPETEEDAGESDEAARPPLSRSATAGRRVRGAEPAIVDHRAARGATRAPRQESFAFPEDHGETPWTPPTIDLFQKPPTGGRTIDRESLILNSRILEKKLRDFGVNGRVVTVHPGPVITMYEFEPASGVKVNRIVSLADDLALALRALSVRIIAPLPGKSVVGIEIPNGEREVVYIRDLLESESYRASPSKLTMVLGKDIFGNPVEADLARMPHLLVAGATGTGKSVFLNSLLCSILFRASPNELKLLLVDPKLLELSVYEGIPHLIADVVTNPKRAAAALAGIVHKMEERYQMMSALGVRSIDQFNARVDEELAAGKKTFRLKPKPGETEGREVEFRRIPYIVVVIDELADLMVVSARDVEEALQRLAQMARAAGIHLVLATQRPSVDVLTGVIKANFPARVSFQVSSRIDSRTILDQNGADLLLGQGDMLFLPPGTSKLRRVHGAFVSEKEVAALVGELRKQGAPVFDDTLVRMKEESEAKEERGDDVDEMYDRAIAIVAETRNASISYIQRRLKVGYNRAARMIEQMELDGIIGPQEGTKPREVYARALDDDE